MRESLERECLKVAIERNELNSFLRGRGLFSLGYNQFEPGNSMLNLGPAMAEIYRYYKDKPIDKEDLALESVLRNK